MERYKRILDLAVRKRKTSYRKISAEYGWIIQQMHQKLKKDTMSVHEYLAFMDILRIDVRLDMSNALSRPNDITLEDGTVEPWWKNFDASRGVVEMSRILDAYNITVTYHLRETGTELTEKSDGMGMRLRAYDGGEMFDTKHGTLISASFHSTDEDRFDKNGRAQELYLGEDGRYFIAIYTKDGKKKIKAVQQEAVDIFLDMYGTYQ